MPEDDDAARLQDAVHSAAARERAADESNTLRDRVRFVLALARVTWRLRREEKRSDEGGRDG